MTTNLGRATSVSREAERVYRALIDHFLATGILADESALATTTGLSMAKVAHGLAELTHADWIGRDERGRIVALYPFSPTATGVRVTLGSVTLHVMCAIDALGAAPLLDRAVSVTAACPVCDQTIHVDAAPAGITRRRPRSTVVIRRRTPGIARLTRCAATRFACSPQHADQWLRQHGGPDDVMQSLEGSFIEARGIFGT
jgi:hypothetical protein